MCAPRPNSHSITEPLPCSGCKVWTLILGFAQPERLCKHGPSFESSQRSPSLGHWHSHHILTVGTWIIPQHRSHSSQVQLHLFAASCEPPDLTEPTFVGTPDIHISLFKTRCCPETLGMRKDHKVETKRDRCGKRRGVARR